MFFPQELRDAYKRYRKAEEENPLFHSAVNRAYEAARQEIEGIGMSCANDDRAESLVAAIALYIEESAE